jgi:uncharacterized protein with von Willebrand factor type A (vWA) domain
MRSASTASGGAPPTGRLAENVMHFARVLRAAGMPVGTDRVQLALLALQAAGLGSRADFHVVLRSCLLDRIEHAELFDHAFELFWRAPAQGAPPGATALPLGRVPPAPPPASRRLAEALGVPAGLTLAPPREEAPDVAADLGASARERLWKADFEAMSADEWRLAQRLLGRIELLFEPLPMRRSRRAAHPGRPDGRATMQAMARHGGELWEMRWRAPRTRPAPLVVLADISGSMSRYSRMLLHFAHALGHADARVESFVFGTRLTRTTRLLKRRDPDLAIAEVVRAVEDWSGGTRITASLAEFNRRWARRVLPGQATVLLISDGLEHGDTAALSFEMERLHKSCRRLVWLNPLLRFGRFQPRAGGIKAMLPHVDRFLPAHNLQSLAELVDVLAAPPRRGPAPVGGWRAAARVA